jgi:hypothetical protein
MTATDTPSEPEPGGTRDSSQQPLGVGSLAANVVAQAAMLVAALARAEEDGGTAAQAWRIGARAGALSISNDAAFASATRQLVATATGEGDGFWLESALAEAAATPGVICATACDLAQLAAHLADTCDGVRRADYVGIAHLSAAAASTSAVLVRSNLVIGDDDSRLMAASAAAADAARAALRAGEAGA